jgi:hypothetical protein
MSSFRLTKNALSVMIDSVPGFTERFAEQDAASPDASIRRVIERRRGGEQKGHRAFGKASFWRLERLNALIWRAAMARRGVEAVEIVRAWEMNVKNGCPAMRSPCIGLETEAERRNRRSNGFAKLSCAVAKVQVGNVDLVMVAKALLRASERPCRDTGSSEMRIR